MIIFDKDHAHAIVLKAQGGDVSAYNEAGKLVLDMLNSIAMKSNWKGYPEEARDMMHGEAVLRMTQGIKTWNPEKSTFYSYMQMICTNAFCTKLKQYKKQKKMAKLPDNYVC